MANGLPAQKSVFQDPFARHYETDAWIGGSGIGSHAVNTQGYVRFLQRFIRANGVKSVVDFGCGDWQFSRAID